MSNQPKSQTHKDFAIGIDLGTTYSCVGVVRNNSVEIIANDQGNRTMPSYVAFSDDERLVGEAAKNQAAMNPANTIFDAKRLIGRKFSNEIVQADKKLWPFEVVQGANDKPMIKIQQLLGAKDLNSKTSSAKDSKDKTFAPEQISAMVLEKLKNLASEYLGVPVTKAVITVPAYFGDAQRQATKDAGLIAGLDVLRVINEPTAAAIAYGLQNKQKLDDEQMILVFDLGGGTFDVSIVIVDPIGTFEVKATNGDSHLGGEDFDQRLMEHFVLELKTKYKKNISDNQRALRRLRTACERAKRTLSTETVAKVEISSLVDGMDFTSSITRARFEEICMDLFQKCMKPLEKVMSDSKSTKSSIQKIVMVGGSTRIPKIQDMVAKYFNLSSTANLCFDINPDEAVAYGAAVQASQLHKHESNTDDNNILLMDVCPKSVGIDVNNGQMCFLIKANSRLPATVKQENFTNAVDNQPAVKISVYEGERVLAKNNTRLDDFMLEIAPAPRNQANIEVTFNISVNGILNVTAVDKASGKSKECTIKTTEKMSSSDFEAYKKEMEQYKEQDERTLKMVTAKNRLDSLTYQIEKSNVADQKKQELLNKIKAWNQDPSQDTPEKIEKAVADFHTEFMSFQSNPSAAAGASADAFDELKNASTKAPGGPKVEEMD